ncbi:MAG: glycosyltransferase [Treponema sp.]|jgi:UDP:flavonoid glycosyltransferase YjiC (YdhE family)|nr:glycosyltransferase [Treponema sp.]
MKILLVTRGSQGDIYPYLILAKELEARGHDVTLTLPKVFEAAAKDAGVHFLIQAFDDIEGMMAGGVLSTGDLLSWTHRVIDSQFDELIPLLREHDILVATNTEFAAPSVAEYCRKPLIRTNYGPFIPSRVIPPPVMPWPRPHPVFRPVFLWKLLNIGLNMMVRKTLNRRRKALGMEPIKDQAEHAPVHSDNYCMYSRYFGTYDPNWAYKWEIGGYCYNDSFGYDRAALKEVLAFIKKDDRPTLFFTLGSCNTKQRDTFADRLFDIVRRHNLKLVVGCGWWKVGAHLDKQENLYLLDTAIPHFLIFPSCDGIIHHGGVGTSHSAARSGRPQMIAPLLLDQFYWGYRVKQLGIGSGSVNMARVSPGRLEKMVLDLVTNPSYRRNALALAEQIRSERGIEKLCEHIESYDTAEAARRLDA